MGFNEAETRNVIQLESLLRPANPNIVVSMKVMFITPMIASNSKKSLNGLLKRGEYLNITRMVIWEEENPQRRGSSPRRQLKLYWIEKEKKCTTQKTNDIKENGNILPL